jgi:hypothetical protein
MTHAEDAERAEDDREQGFRIQAGHRESAKADFA